MELTVRHQTTYRYTTPAAKVAMLLRLVPARLDGQQPRDWEVTVNGLAPYEHRRVYQLERKSDNLAAHDGIELFCDEMNVLADAEDMGALWAGMDEQAG